MTDIHPLISNANTAMRSRWFLDTSDLPLYGFRERERLVHAVGAYLTGSIEQRSKGPPTL